MAHLFPSCREAAHRVSEQHDAPLSGPARFGLWLHLALCAHCRRFSRQIKFLRAAVSQYPNHLAQAKLPDHTRHEIIRKLSALP